MTEKKPLINKLEEMRQRYKEIEQQLLDPEIVSDHNKLIPLTKEQGKLKNIVTKYEEYCSMLNQINETEQMLADTGNDPEMKELAQMEHDQLVEDSEKLFEDIQNSFIMADDEAINAIIIEIRAGTGGDEASLFVRDIYEMYIRYAEVKRWKVEQLDFRQTEMGGFREVILSVKGPSVWSEFGYESGNHRVQRVPETESQGRIHTSAITVAVLPEPEEVEVEINPADVLEHVSRAGGPGGQSVNKINSAIKLEHIPTGITVSMRDEKSQHKNRAKAWRILRSRIYEDLIQKERQQRDSQRKQMIGTGDRSQKIRTYNFPQNRVTDHRINLSLYNLDKVLAGDMTEIITALKEHDRRERLENL